MATIYDEYVRAITGGNTTRRQEVLAIIAEYCRTITPDERIIVEVFFTEEKFIRSRLSQRGISLTPHEFKKLLQIVLRPLAIELGIRITGEQTGDAAEIIAKARRRYEERRAARARRATRNPNETRGRPPKVEKVLPEADPATGYGGSSIEIRHTFFPEARADATPEPVSEKTPKTGKNNKNRKEKQNVRRGHTETDEN